LEPIEADLRPPLAPVGASLRRFDGEKAMVVELSRFGRIRVGGATRSLSGFLLLLGNEEPAARDRIVLRVDGEAPWQHVAHLLTALQRRGIEGFDFVVRRKADRRDSARDALEFAVPREPSAEDLEERVLAVRLLRHDRSAKPRIGAPILARNRLEIAAEREIESTFGPQGRTVPASRPLNVRMTWNDRATYSFPQLREWILKQRAQRIGNSLLWAGAPQKVVAAIGEKVPARFAIAALATIQEIGWQEVYFFAPLEQEDSVLLGAMAMPYPRTNRLLRGSDGIHAE
jgi:hypothetical protein